MSDRDLRARLIRLAHTHPEFRDALLPLIKSAGQSDYVLRVEKGKGRGSYSFKTPEDAVSAAGDHGSFSDKDKAKGLALLRDGKPWSVASSAGSFTISPPKGGGKKASGDGQSADDYWDGLEPKKPAIDEPALPPKTAGKLTRKGLLDYLINSLEHEPSDASAVKQLQTWGADPGFAQDLIAAVSSEGPHLIANVMRQQQAFENIVDKVAQKHGVRLASKPASDTVHFPGKPGFTLCGERVDSRSVVSNSPREATCYYCGMAWEKANGPLPMYARVQMGIRTAAWENLPPGWTQESVQSMWDTMTDGVKHKVTKCMKEMADKVDNTGAFCGSLADKVDPGWRSRGANTEKEAIRPRPQKKDKCDGTPASYADYRSCSDAENPLTEEAWKSRQRGSHAWGINASLLRKAAIRVAHENPELRPALLPFLSKKA